MQLSPQGSNTSTPVTRDWIAIAALIFAGVSFLVTAAGLYISVRTEVEKGNADLVQIGVNVLRVDPEKEKQISAAREWALNLIDANAGGVKFSPEAREHLLKEPLDYSQPYSTLDSADTTYPPEKPAPRRPSAEPPK